MFPKALLLATLVALVTTSPVAPREALIKLPLTQVNTVTNFANLVARGQATINKINSGSNLGSSDASSGSVTNEDVSYVAPVNIGGNTWSLIVDTGSSNTWCGAQKSCEPTSTGQSTGDPVIVMYGSGDFVGIEYIDKVSFAGLTVSSQSIGSALASKGFTGVDGIIGFGPVDLTEDTVIGQTEVPTFMDNLYKQGSISTEVLGVSFRPEPGSSNDTTNGELTLGGTDPSKYTGALTYFPKLTSGDAAPYWGIAISSFKYGSTVLSTNAQGIVDTGTTLIYIPSAAYKKFTAATGGSTNSEGVTQFRKAPTENFVITFGSTPYTLTPSQYLIPEAQYSDFGLKPGKYYSYIANGGTGTTSTIVGQKFMEQYYAVFDTTNSRIGFAKGV